MDAGNILAEAMSKNGFDFSGFSLVAIARGGVIVAEQVAKRFELPLSAICVEETLLKVQKKVQFVFATSLLEKGCLLLGKEQINFFSEPSSFLTTKSDVSKAERLIRETSKRGRFYNDGELKLGTRIIVCDDGLSSGNTVVIASYALKMLGAKEVLLAVPIVPPWVPRDGSVIRRFFDKILYWRVTTLKNPTVGIFYFEFNDVPDDEVIASIRRNREIVKCAF
jgi:predicted phosphoribosyltransferase